MTPDPEQQPAEPILYRETGQDTIDKVRALSPHGDVLVSFSRGKDSIATYLAIRDHFDNIACYTYEVVPDLEFVEESLQYFEQKMGHPILRYPAPGLYRMLDNAVYQPHDRLALIERFCLPQLSHDDLQEFACSDAGIHPESYNAVGMRSKDSVQRAFTIAHNGTINHTRRIFYPVHDLDKQQVIDLIRRAGWKLPIDYRYFSASFDGLYVKFLYPIKLYFPRDFRKICEWFPYAEMECLRYEAAIRAGKQPAYIPPPGAIIHGV